MIAVQIHPTQTPIPEAASAFASVCDSVVPLLGPEGRALVLCLAIGRKYASAFASGQGGSFDITELQSDLLVLSGTLPFVGALAANWRGRANQLKLDAQYHETMAQQRRLDAAAAGGHKTTKTQLQAEARCDVYGAYVQQLTADSAANLLQNSCVALQELVNTIKHIGNRLLVEMEQTPG